MTLILPDWLVARRRRRPWRGWGCGSSATGSTTSGRTASCSRPSPHDDVVDAAGTVADARFRQRSRAPLRGAGPRDPRRRGARRVLELPRRLLVAQGRRRPRPRDDRRRHRLGVRRDAALAAPPPSTTSSRRPAPCPRRCWSRPRWSRTAALRGILSFEATERAGPAIAEAGLAENAALIAASRRQRPGLGDDVLPHHVHVLGRLHPPGVRAGRRSRRALTHAHCNEGLHEAAVVPGQHRHAHPRVLRAAGSGRSGVPGQPVRAAVTTASGASSPSTACASPTCRWPTARSVVASHRCPS